MDTTLGKSEDFSCRCCHKIFSDEQLLHSIFEYTNDEMELYRILTLLTSISISRNDGKNFVCLYHCLFIMHISIKKQIVKEYISRILTENLRRVQEYSCECLSLPTNVH